MADPDSDDKKPLRLRGGKTGGYILTNVLQPPRVTTYTTQSLLDQIVAGDIDLEPEYPCDVKWPEEKQVGLIDSIFHNFYIPPIIFAVNTYDNGSESKICIEGKQRFMLGLIYCTSTTIIPPAFRTAQRIVSPPKIAREKLCAMKSPCAGFIKSINPAKYQRTEDTDTEPASIQLKLVKFEPIPPVDTSSGSKRRRIETKNQCCQQ
ncbi:hypothetical protein AGABI2DRAFT_121752 [Agaricus bisporus var. bisporus H97]|uniref:hypothetical protein n=1 Tax=Agaricus bisporus var. bisporus (strain H97 / ATCC MYA-4626 / FGSC 10389) TaxID=936046 RepID=UPI00029F7448|nr:hypothetical protein AGABI2DRAFT_121752 [Agaricus bisporus var. bisporus H97]EKV43608.1 hypothetical protein AGABI2DRAFT_121752 [Agaricus bisporus var. bisporus H97]